MCKPAVYGLCTVLLAACAQTLARAENSSLAEQQGCQVMQVSVLDEGAERFFSRRWPDQHPYFLQADINGDGFLDEAVIASCQTVDRSGTYLMIGVTHDSTDIVPSLIEDVSSYRDIIFLSKLPVGAVVENSEALADIRSDSVQLRNPGVRVTYYEKASIAYYWSTANTALVSVQTAD